MQNSSLNPTDAFVDRHVGPRQRDIEAMLHVLDMHSLDDLIDRAVPAGIRMNGELRIGEALSENRILKDLRNLADRNKVLRSYIGLGYHDCIVPPALLRNILENPGWYTQYTPYQAEISQGRLEALLAFQTLISDLTGLEVANASLLDEGTAAAEAMTLAHRVVGKKGARALFASDQCHPQTLEVVKMRAEPLGFEVIVGDHETFDFSTPVFAVLVQYPTTDGTIRDYRAFAERAHENDALVIVAADLMSLTLLIPPGDFGADVCVGSAQRFGTPLGYGGPHAAFFTTRDDYKRKMPGRIVGVSRDSRGKTAYRLALATREQHIRREKATSNICTAQVLLAIMAGMYGVYHGPRGLKKIAGRIRHLAAILGEGLERLGYDVNPEPWFDTVKVDVGSGRADPVLAAALETGINLRRLDDATVCVALDETVTAPDLDDLFRVFALGRTVDFSAEDLAGEVDSALPGAFTRTDAILTHPVFHRYHSESELMRYLHRLQAMDLSLTTSMIPLGSCTMKLNAAAELLPITWPKFSCIHPFAPADQAGGYLRLIVELEAMLADATGFQALSFQPNAGASGEYTGLLVIRAFHRSRGDAHRTVCLIPESAHGTNPASAALAGMDIDVVKCDAAGNIDVEDLKVRAEKHGDNLAALMVTYPSTHGVFEDSIREVCDIVHACGGQVYLDGANMNALVGVCKPADIGADVCHLNLHKTFAIPHGGGGPGAGPIGVKAHLKPFLPGHPLVKCGGEEAIGPVAAAPFGSASILPISYAYVAMMGAAGLKKATQVAILNANYMAKRLEAHYPVLYKGPGGLVAHEFILDTRSLKDTSGIKVEDIAKRLMDFGFHAPTVSFPVPGTLMIEPTESESREELDRLIEALICIRKEAADIESGKADADNNPLKRAPHTAEEVTADAWDRPYGREEAAYPAAWTRLHKYWPPVSRIDNVWGDRNFSARFSE